MSHGISMQCRFSNSDTLIILCSLNKKRQVWYTKWRFYNYLPLPHYALTWECKSASWKPSDFMVHWYISIWSAVYREMYLRGRGANMNLTIIPNCSFCPHLVHLHIHAAVPHLLYYTFWTLKKSRKFTQVLLCHQYLQYRKDMVLCSQIQTWRLQGLSATSISIPCYIQAFKQGYMRVIELHLAGWNCAQLIEYLKNLHYSTGIVPLLHNSLWEINDSEGFWVNRFEGRGEKKSFYYFYFPLSLSKEEGKNHFTEPQAWPPFAKWMWQLVCKLELGLAMNHTG